MVLTEVSSGKPLPLRELLSQLWVILTPRDRLRAAFLLFLILLGTCLEILGIGLIIPVVTLLSQPDFTDESSYFHTVYQLGGAPSHRIFMLWALGGLLIVFIVKNVFLILSAYWSNRTIYNYQARLQEELVSGYLNRPYTFHLQHTTAELLQKINGEVGVLISNILKPALLITSESLVVLGILSLAIWMDPQGTLIAMGSLGVVLLAYYHYFKIRVEFWGRNAQEHAQGMYRELQHGLGGIKEVKIFGKENFFCRTFMHHTKHNVQSQQWYNFLSQSSRQVIELFIISVLLSAIMLLVWRGVGMDALVPTLAFYAAAAFRLMPSTQRLLSSAHNIRYGARSLYLLKPDLLYARTQGTPCQNDWSPMQFDDRLAICDVTFCYSGGNEDVLKEINFVIPRGSMVGFQGQSGVGKTTLVDIILGLLEPTRGEVTVDGVPIQDNLSGWQANIGYVPQSIVLIDDTLRRNIAFGLEEEEIDDERVNEVLRQAQLEDFVKSRPEGIETLVGERGVRLSGGQRQRIGIARALYHDPDILVLDEATASLDLDTETEFIRTVESLKNKKTVLMISHRLSTMAKCDSKYHLEKGQLRELVREPT